MDIKGARNYFPYLKSGKKYFNHAAISPLPSDVNEKICEYFQIRSETEIEPYFLTLSQATSAKDKLANLLNVSSKQLAWSPNVSSSLNVLAQGLKWEYGDEIILNNIEFPSNIYPFLNLKKEGVTILFAEAEKGIVDVTQIEKLISPRTKLISISMVQFLTGYRADLISLGNLCKEKGILFCVDGIQGVGAIEININECNIDFFTGGTHKWLMGLQGLGYFYISEGLMDRIEQKHVGWTSVKNTWNLLDYQLDLLESADRYQCGTLPRVAIIALDASLNFFEKFGFSKIEKQIIDNSTYLAELLIKKGYKPLLESISKKNIAGIVSFTHGNAKMIIDKLEMNNTICTTREGVIRISPHFYNTKDELNDLVAEIMEAEKVI